MSSWFSREVKSFERDEEKVVVTIGTYRLRKKSFFAFLLSTLIFMVGLSKIESLHELGRHVSPVGVLFAVFVALLVIMPLWARDKLHSWTFFLYAIFFGVTIFLPAFNVLDALFLTLLMVTAFALLYEVL